MTSTNFNTLTFKTVREASYRELQIMFKDAHKLGYFKDIKVNSKKQILIAALLDVIGIVLKENSIKSHNAFNTPRQSIQGKLPLVVKKVNKKRSVIQIIRSLYA